MIEVHNIPASASAATEWTDPYGPGSTFRLLLVRVDAGNNAVSPGRVVLSLAINGKNVWSVASDPVPASDIGIVWFAFDGHTDRQWNEGTELREIVSVPYMPPITSQRVTLRIEPQVGGNMNFSGLVYVDRHDDPRTN